MSESNQVYTVPCKQCMALSKRVLESNERAHAKGYDSTVEADDRGEERRNDHGGGARARAVLADGVRGRGDLHFLRVQRGGRGREPGADGALRAEDAGVGARRGGGSQAPAAAGLPGAGAG